VASEENDLDLEEFAAPRNGLGSVLSGWSALLNFWSSTIALWSQRKAYFLTIEVPGPVCDLSCQAESESIRVLLK
jgi:hypothetical protein